jgi:CRP-like cAMP-binding protein
MAEARRGQVISTLRRVQLFSDCSNEELALVESLLSPVEMGADAALLHQGEPGRQFFVITQGYARVKRGSTDLGVVGPGSFVGEMALLHATATSAAVTAITPVTAYMIDRQHFQLVIDRVPSIGEKVRRTAAQRASEISGYGATR